MSSSPKLSPVAAAPSAPALSKFQAFPYDAIAARAVAPGTTLDGGADPASREAEIRAQGQREGQVEAGKIFAEQLGRERAGLAVALAQFTRDRGIYFQKVESEVVQLALAIARKILHRESQLDPLLLAGIVRVALDQIDGATGVRLRIHPGDSAEWRRYLNTHLDPSDLPEIVEDPAQPLDSCVLETAMGTATVGVEAQLKEIEQGFMDLLAARPGACP